MRVALHLFMVEELFNQGQLGIEGVTYLSSRNEHYCLAPPSTVFLIHSVSNHISSKDKTTQMRIDQ
jgi:hypothetical protein